MNGWLVLGFSFPAFKAIVDVHDRFHPDQKPKNAFSAGCLTLAVVSFLQLVRTHVSSDEINQRGEMRNHREWMVE